MKAADENVEIYKKRVIRKLLVIFFCVMAFLTFFSNTIMNFTLPRVKTEYAVGGSLVKELTGEGTVEARDSQYAYTHLNAVVEAVNVKAGDKVREGQVLMTLERQEAGRQLREAAILLEKQRLALQKLEDDAAALAADEVLDPEVAAAIQKLEEKEAGFSNIKLLYNAGAEALSALKTAESELADAKRAYKKALQAYGANKSRIGRELQEARFDLELKQLQVDKLGYELENCYIIKAKCSGIVKEVNFEKGTMTNSAKPLCIVANSEKGYEFNTAVDADIAKYFSEGDTVNVRIKALGGEAVKGIITRITDSEPQKGKQKEFHISIEEQRLTGGETGEIHQNKDIGYYDILVPNSAVHSEIGGKFVWVVRDKRGPLGTEHYLAKASVTVGESDSGMTAVLSGLGGHDRIVTGIKENKIVSESSRVIIAD